MHYLQMKVLLSPTFIKIAEDHQQTVKESKGTHNQLKKALGLGSQSAPQSRFNRDQELAIGGPAAPHTKK